MTNKFQNKYRIESNRLKNWDYGSNAAYFITICTANREHFFGEIEKTQCLACPSEMVLSDIGHIAHKFWLEIPNHYPFVELGDFVIMPNHMHGIIIINKKTDKNKRHINANCCDGKDAMNRVSNENDNDNRDAMNRVLRMPKCNNVEVLREIIILCYIKICQQLFDGTKVV